jgi:hypothetical protein
MRSQDEHVVCAILKAGEPHWSTVLLLSTYRLSGWQLRVSLRICESLCIGSVQTRGSSREPCEVLLLVRLSPAWPGANWSPCHQLQLLFK